MTLGVRRWCENCGKYTDSWMLGSYEMCAGCTSPDNPASWDEDWDSWVVEVEDEDE